jgi:hypothetical protein
MRFDGISDVAAAGADPLAESRAAEVVDTEVLPWLT